MKRNLAFLCLVIFPCIATAEVYAEFGFESGGETLGSTSEEDLNLAGGMRLALGIQSYIGGFDDVGLLFSVGYLYDEIEASNGTAQVDATVLEFIYFRNFGPHQIGTGGSYHINPRYKQNLDGFSRLNISFDDSLGFQLRYSYSFSEAFSAGARYTVMDYETDGSSLDADSLGIFLSGSF